jgi:hypothetical protein
MRFACLLVSLPCTTKFNTVGPKDQNRLLLFQYWQFVLNPSSNGAFCDTKSPRSFINGVGAMDLDAPPIRLSETKLRTHANGLAFIRSRFAPMCCKPRIKVIRIVEHDTANVVTGAIKLTLSAIRN